jgi:hypothetical protein
MLSLEFRACLWRTKTAKEQPATPLRWQWFPSFNQLKQFSFLGFGE